jgi:hypothetical protein
MLTRGVSESEGKSSIERPNFLIKRGMNKRMVILGQVKVVLVRRYFAARPGMMFLFPMVEGYRKSISRNSPYMMLNLKKAGIMRNESWKRMK